MHNNEAELETDIYNYLIASERFCCVKRQFTILNSGKRLDLIAIDNALKVWIFEVKLKFSKKAVAQILDYKEKYKPKMAVLVYEQGEYEEVPLEGYSVYRWDGEFRLERHVETEYPGVVPNYILVRLNCFYQQKLLKNMDTYWCNDAWYEYFMRQMRAMGYKTRNAMMFWFERKHAKKSLKIEKQNYSLERWIPNKEADEDDEV